MSALSFYFDGIEDGNLPASVPILEIGSSGMATVIFSPSEKESVEEMAFSNDEGVRAKLAVYACHAAREVALEDLGLHSL